MDDNASNCKKNHFEAKKEKIILFQSPRITSCVEHLKFHDGQTKTYQSLSHHGAVAIVAFDESYVYMVKQYRHVSEKIVLEIPAGLIDPNETPKQAANRELEEEIGFKAHDLSFYKKILTSPGILHEEIHLFLAKNLVPSFSPADDTHEIDRVKIPINVAISDDFIYGLEDAKTIIGLNHLKKLCEDL